MSYNSHDRTVVVHAKNYLMLTRRLALAILVMAPLSACELIDAHRDIYGKWRPEQLSFGGVGLPVGPSLEFSRDMAVVDGKSLPIQGFVKKENVITVHISDGPSLTFEMVDSTTMTISLPVIGKIKYRKMP